MFFEEYYDDYMAKYMPIIQLINNNFISIFSVNCFR